MRWPLALTSLGSFERIDLLRCLCLLDRYGVGRHITGTHGPLGRWFCRDFAEFDLIELLNVATSVTRLDDRMTFATVVGATILCHEYTGLTDLEGRTCKHGSHLPSGSTVGVVLPQT